MMYHYTPYGWYTSAAVSGRDTDIAPPDSSTTTTPGEARANWDGHAWVMQPYVTEPDNTAAIAAAAKAQAVADKWDDAKAERDRRKSLGVKVGANWFHSDDSSRIQQLALVMLAANIPANLQWKTLTHSGAVFVTMTQALAGGIFQSTLHSDTAVFSAAEAHRVAINASTTPESYDVMAGWPASFEDSV